jgi:ATP-binding cassette, subfamily B, bacterial HlyB/CyaB
MATTLQSQVLSTLPPFNQLSPEAIAKLQAASSLLRYRIGQPVAVAEQMPTQISILLEGQLRVLGSSSSGPLTLQRLEAGAMVGWISLLRDVPTELVIASSEAVCLHIPRDIFLAQLRQSAALQEYFYTKVNVSELFSYLTAALEQQALVVDNLADLARSVAQQGRVEWLTSGTCNLAPSFQWFLSAGEVTGFAPGDRLPNTISAKRARVVGIPQQLLGEKSANSDGAQDLPQGAAQEGALATIPYAPEIQASRPDQPGPRKFPLVSARGPVESTLACFQMLSQFFGLSFRRDTVRRIVESQYQSHQNIPLPFCGAVAESMGLSSQMVQVPTKAMTRIQTPALIEWQDSFAVLYKASPQEMVLGVPEQGLVKRSVAQFAQTWGDGGGVLLLQATPHTPTQRFNLRWFIPAMKRHRRVLIEVLIASMFVQLLGLANPIITQVIIDKVLNLKSLDALQVMGLLLMGFSLVEAVLTNIRTHLFTDTTNRIDMALSSEVINHLLRLPLRYFEKRPVGELSSRVGELEKVRQFLTGTALTVCMDAVFSVIYILVMLVYSPLLTAVALATIPLFAALTLLVSPVIRNQSRRKSERFAQTQSFLVETLSGIQTVKAQNLEMRSRWQWQEHYARYIGASFTTVSTQTTAGSISGFLNKFSSLLVLWVGAYLVIDNKLSLGQLIAFRIIAGYVTSPLLRLVQLWQNFQETALSLERLGDVLDAPTEQEDAQQKMLMPEIQGAVKFEDLTFSFRDNGPPQLHNINLEFAPGTFIGIVGQSGSGKSTLTKLLSRLYEPQTGKVILDGYDISKVELYSLRRQIGMVLQDTLLFDGTIRDNIALVNPEASDEQITAAAQVAFAHDFIMALPNGYSTRVGERGSALSGGQRQRIAIARTVLQDPNLIILDEATSALDYIAEHQVCHNLAEAFQDRTVFFITHRLATIRNADVILMMDQGVVVEQGRHEELMQRRGYYYALYQQQSAEGV